MMKTCVGEKITGELIKRVTAEEGKCGRDKAEHPGKNPRVGTVAFKRQLRRSGTVETVHAGEEGQFKRASEDG